MYVHMLALLDALPICWPTEARMIRRLPVLRWKRLQPRTLADAPESMDPRLRGDDGQRLFRSAGELLRQHPLLEVVLGIEQQRHRTVARLADHDLHDVAHLVRIGGRADRPLVRVEHVETDLRFGLEPVAAPTSRPGCSSEKPTS